MGFIADEIIAKAEEPDNSVTYVTRTPIIDTNDEKIDKITQHIMHLRSQGLAAQAAAYLNHTDVPGSSQLAPYQLSGSGPFIKATSPVSNGWQTICRDDDGPTEQLRVAGGWLYRTWVKGNVAMTFAPDPR